MKRIKYDRFEPCEHKGCLNHLSHPCEGCGRVGGDGVIYEEDEDKTWFGVCMELAGETE